MAKRGILIVTYDLKGPSALYSALFTYLKSHEGWNHYLASTWMIDTRKSPEEVVDEMRPHIQKGDRYLVTRLERPYQGLLPRKSWEWIKRHRELIESDS